MQKFRDFIRKVFVKRWPLWLLGLIIIGGILFFLNKNGEYEIVQVEPTDFVREVSVVGTVVPAQETNMAFEMSGRVVAIYKKVGDKVFAGERILSLESGDLQSELLKAEADYDAEVAQLNKMKNTNSTADLTEIKNQIRSSFTVADDAVRLKVDQLYEDPNTRFPETKFYIPKYELEEDLEEQRYRIGLILSDWQPLAREVFSVNDLSTLKSSYQIKSKEYLNEVLSFLDDISYALSISEPGGDISQADLDKYISDISSARTNINQSLSDLNDSFEKVSNNTQDIPYQEAKVKSARASIEKIRAELSKNIITSPFSGILTKVDTEVGEIVGTTDSVISIISDNAFQIEAFVPEVNIKDVKVGDLAQVELDAFGSDETFSAVAISIEPAQTIRDGVSSYKTKFEFSKKDERIRSGMTASVVITTEKRPNTIIIPSSVIYKKDGFDYVKVLVGGQDVEKQVTLGGFDAVGNREVVSGLSVGEKIIKNKQN